MRTFRTLADYRSLPPGQDRTLEFIISSERKDRHGTVLDINGWVLDSYNKNPIVGYQHDIYGDNPLKGPDPDNVIGVARVYRDGNLLIGAVAFEPEDLNPLAEKIYRKVLAGTLRAASVGFLPIDKPAGHWGTGDQAQSGKNATFFYGRRELLEFSIVNIPSNSDAVRRAFEKRQLAELKTISPDLTNLDAKLKLAGVTKTKKQRDLAIMKIDLALNNIK
jgi:hypothetical protein